MDGLRLHMAVAANRDVVSQTVMYGTTSDGLALSFRSDPRGVLELPGLPSVIVGIHVGRPALIACRRGGDRHSGTAVHGDIDIIPANTPSMWEMKDANDTALVLSLSPQLLRGVAEQMHLDHDRVRIKNRFQVRDPQIENICWALKSEMESGFPSGRLYTDSLAVSVATRLICCHSSAASAPKLTNGGLSGRRLKQVLAYIEENLSQDLSLADLAGIACVSPGHLKRLFREAVGLPVHQYVIRRRLERAKSLLSEGMLPISQVALESGFAHQSHLARHMRRVLGRSPRELRRTLG